MQIDAPDFSGMVRAVRLSLHLNQAQFAQLLGVTPAAVLLWERGERRPEGAALRLLFALNEQLKTKQLAKADLDKVIEAIAVGAAAIGLVALLGALFSKAKR